MCSRAHCRANTTHVRQSRPDSCPGYQFNVSRHSAAKASKLQVALQVWCRRPICLLFIMRRPATHCVQTGLQVAQGLQAASRPAGTHSSKCGTYNTVKARIWLMRHTEDSQSQGETPALAWAIFRTFSVRSIWNYTLFSSRSRMEDGQAPPGPQGLCPPGAHQIVCFRSLMCKGARGNPATCGANQDVQKRRFESSQWVAGGAAVTAAGVSQIL